MAKIETVKSQSGSREHIIEGDQDWFSSTQDVVCQIGQLAGDIYEYESLDEVTSLCQNCEQLHDG